MKILILMFLFWSGFQKPGPCKTRLIKGSNPSVVSWDKPKISGINMTSGSVTVQEDGYISNYYNSQTIYFAVSK